MHQKIQGVGNNAHERAELPGLSETGYSKRYTQGSLQPYEDEMKNPNQPEPMDPSQAVLESYHLLGHLFLY